MDKRILLTECSDATGLIAKITDACFQHNLIVIRQDQFASAEDGKFFMRSVVEGNFEDQDGIIDDVRKRLPEGAKVRLNDSRRRRICVLVTKEAHCLGELLMKSYSGALNADIVSVIGNHEDLGGLAAKFNVPFTCFENADHAREEQEQLILNAIDESKPDLVVLAKYMRILSPKFIRHFKMGTLVNIHHSFLPAFMGAKPYYQAFTRGVKLIGATAHFVTDNLDEGPIIEQDVIKVNHRYDPETLAKAGHDVEQMVLLRAVNKILDDKVFVHGNKTVVF